MTDNQTDPRCIAAGFLLSGDKMTDENKETKVLANGAIADVKTGVIIRGAPLSSSQARAIAKKRWEKAQAAAIRGLRHASGSDSALQAWSDLIGEQYKLAMNIDAARASTEAARFVGQAAGFLVDRRQAAGNSGENPLETLGAEVASRILAMLDV